MVIFKNLSYLPPDVTAYTNYANGGQRFSMFYPEHEPSFYGWNRGYPVLLHLNNEFFTTSSGTLADGSNTPITSGYGLRWQALKRGIAVAEAQSTVADAAQDGTAGLPDISGRGYFNPPGLSGGYYESKTRPTGKKDAIYFIQHIRYNAALYGIDPEAVAFFGRSSSFDHACYCIYGPDHAGELGQGGQYDMPTHPNCAMGQFTALVWWQAYDQTTDSTILTNQFPTTAGGNVEALDLSAVGADATESARFQQAASVFGYTPFKSAQPPPVYLLATEPSTNFNFSEPYDAAFISAAQIHQWWAFAALKAKWPSKTFLHVLQSDDVGAPTAADVALLGNLVDLYGPDWNDPGIAGLWGPGHDGDTTGGVDNGGEGGSAINWLCRNITRPRVTARPHDAWTWRSAVNTAGRLVVPASSIRQAGVYIANEDATNDLLYGSDSDSAAVIGPEGSAFFMGKGPLWLRGSTAPIDFSVTEM